MKILILGGDGYLGWPTALHFSHQGHEVGVVDNFARRQYDHEMGTDTLVPIANMSKRIQTWREVTTRRSVTGATVSGRTITPFVGDMTDGEFVYKTLYDFSPDAVVHFAEQRSAPYSMIDRQHAVYTQVNNVTGTLNLLYAIADINPDIHIVKLGTMGEYGTPNIDIEEGFIEINHKGRVDVLPFPKQPGSFYHLSKVHDSHNIAFACKTWQLRSTDLNQGIVYGQQTPQTALHPDLATRYDYDGVFGTVLNRFIVQAVAGYPLTVYGKGGQIRGILDIRDTLACIELAVLNPPEAGEYRVFNQFTESYSVLGLANMVVRVAGDNNIGSSGSLKVEHFDDPRVEDDEHYYRAAHTKLLDLGLVPHLLDDDLISSLLDLVEQYQFRINVDTIKPTVNWRDTKSLLYQPTEF